MIEEYQDNRTGIRGTEEQREEKRKHKQRGYINGESKSEKTSVLERLH